MRLSARTPFKVEFRFITPRLADHEDLARAATPKETPPASGRQDLNLRQLDP